MTQQLLISISLETPPYNIKFQRVVYINIAGNAVVPGAGSKVVGGRVLKAILLFLSSAIAKGGCSTKIITLYTKRHVVIPTVTAPMQIEDRNRELKLMGRLQFEPVYGELAA